MTARSIHGAFVPTMSSVNWLPFVMQETDRDVIDLNTGECA